jgi:hypothetical protein
MWTLEGSDVEHVDARDSDSCVRIAIGSKRKRASLDQSDAPMKIGTERR